MTGAGALRLAFPPARNGKRVLSVLCVGAHADDIEIGCGGTLRALFASRPVDCRWVVFSGGEGPREREARASARRFLRAARRAQVEVHAFRDGFFPAAYAEIKERFAALKADGAADVVFTHYRGDRHQDHRVVSDLTWNTFRDHLILEYEVPKYDGDLGRPNLYVPLSRAASRAKVRHLLAAFATQRAKRWFTADTFDGLLRLRGIEAGAPEGYAEAFHAHKALLEP
ncbi:MAG: PIG-L deacetylase family protein [Gemmatimonadales bacterium]